MLGIIYLVLSALFYGFSNAYWKKAIQDVPFLQVIFSRGLYTTSFFGLCYLVDWQWGFFQPWLGIRPAFSAPQLGLSLGLCIFSAFGLYFFVRSLTTGAVSLVAPISSINLFGILTAVVFLKESWSLNYCFAFICICLGIYLIFKADWHFTSLRSFFQSSGGSILASFFWGVSYSLFKYPITWMGVLPFSFLLELCVTLFAGGILVFQNQPWKPMPLLPIRVLALCIILGSIFLHISYQTATVTQIIFVSKSQLLMTLFFGQILYKEKLDFQKSIGVLLLIFSIYLAI